jgi:hypothetical protein
MIMSSLHRRDPRGDWTLDIHQAGYQPLSLSYQTPWLYSPPRYTLSLSLTPAQATALAGLQNRGCPSFRHLYNSYGFHAENIELTEAEVNQIAHGGAHPLDVLFPVWPEHGYRLVAVLTDLGKA